MSWLRGSERFAVSCGSAATALCQSLSSFGIAARKCLPNASRPAASSPVTPSSSCLRAIVQWGRTPPDRSELGSEQRGEMLEDLVVQRPRLPRREVDAARSGEIGVEDPDLLGRESGVVDVEVGLVVEA